MAILNSKMATMQVLGGLIKKPILFTGSEYNFEVSDFPEQFHQIVFSAVEHLASFGVEKISAHDIDEYLKPHSSQYKVFSDNNGMEYVAKVSEYAELKNFNHYYNVFKKFSLLRKMNNLGYDTSALYNTAEENPRKIEEMLNRFEQLSVEDIIEAKEAELMKLKNEYSVTGGAIQNKAGDGLLDLLDELKVNPEMGRPLISKKLTTICRGRRLKKFYIESAAQGTGKTRRAAGEACSLAVPEYYNTNTHAWEKHEFKEKVLMLVTELELAEVQTMWLAYVSGVPEDHILDNKFNFDEEERVRKAAEYIRRADLYFVQISNADIDDIESIIKEYHFINGVDYVFYDYLSTSMKILQGATRRTAISDLKEYQVLNLFGQRLKDMCNKYNIHIQTATQLSGDWRSGVADQQLLRGAKAIADQPDIGTILLNVREEDRPIIDAYKSKGFEKEPNMVIHVYKVRRGKYNSIRLYVYFDKGTCRMEDCFATDNQGNEIDVPDTILSLEDDTVETILDQTSMKDLPDEMAQAFVF